MTMKNALIVLLLCAPLLVSGDCGIVRAGEPFSQTLPIDTGDLAIATLVGNSGNLEVAIYLADNASSSSSSPDFTTLDLDGTTVLQAGAASQFLHVVFRQRLARDGEQLRACAALMTMSSISCMGMNQLLRCSSTSAVPVTVNVPTPADCGWMCYAESGTLDGDCCQFERGKCKIYRDAGRTGVSAGDSLSYECGTKPAATFMSSFDAAAADQETRILLGSGEFRLPFVASSSLRTVRVHLVNLGRDDTFRVQVKSSDRARFDAGLSSGTNGGSSISDYEDAEDDVLSTVLAIERPNDEDSATLLIVLPSADDDGYFTIDTTPSVFARGLDSANVSSSSAWLAFLVFLGVGFWMWKRRKDAEAKKNSSPTPADGTTGTAMRQLEARSQARQAPRTMPMAPAAPPMAAPVAASPTMSQSGLKITYMVSATSAMSPSPRSSTTRSAAGSSAPPPDLPPSYDATLAL